MRATKRSCSLLNYSNMAVVPFLKISPFTTFYQARHLHNLSTIITKKTRKPRIKLNYTQQQKRQFHTSKNFKNH